MNSPGEGGSFVGQGEGVPDWLPGLERMRFVRIGLLVLLDMPVVVGLDTEG